MQQTAQSQLHQDGGHTVNLQDPASGKNLHEDHPKLKKIKTRTTIIEQREGNSSYYEQYNNSYFAYTCKKGGWDCMRHYEIIAAGCLPVFKDFDMCPKYVLTTWPTLLQYDANIFYYTISIFIFFLSHIHFAPHTPHIYIFICFFKI